MTAKSKTRHAGRVCRCIEPCSVCDYKSSTPAPPKQPRPGTALSFLLRRYRSELDAWQEQHGDRQTQGLIDCCSVLLNEAKRGAA